MRRGGPRRGRKGKNPRGGMQVEADPSQAFPDTGPGQSGNTFQSFGGAPNQFTPAGPGFMPNANPGMSFVPAAPNAGFPPASTGFGPQRGDKAPRKRLKKAKTQPDMQNAGFAPAAETGFQPATPNMGFQPAGASTGFLQSATNTGFVPAGSNTGFQPATQNAGFQPASTGFGANSGADAPKKRQKKAKNQPSEQSQGFQPAPASQNTGFQQAAINAAFQPAPTNFGFTPAAANDGFQLAQTGFGSQSNQGFATPSFPDVQNTGFQPAPAGFVPAGVDQTPQKGFKERKKPQQSAQEFTGPPKQPKQRQPRPQMATAPPQKTIAPPQMTTAPQIERVSENDELESQLRNRAIKSIKKQRRAKAPVSAEPMPSSIPTKPKTETVVFREPQIPQPVVRQPQIPQPVVRQPQILQPVAVRTHQSIQGMTPDTSSSEYTYIDTMCSDAEANLRQETGNISDFERDPATGQVRRDLLVSIYKRAAAGEAVKYVRTKHALLNSWNFLKQTIVDSDKDFQSIYLFTWNRGRQICKEYRMLSDVDYPNYIKILEEISRFYVMSFSHGIGSEDFDPHLNNKALENVLITLQKIYKDGHNSTNQAEFIAYKLIFRMENIEQASRWIMDVPQAILKDQQIQMAISAVSAFHTRNYGKFFKIVDDAPYLISCLLISKFEFMRKQVIHNITEWYKGQISAQSFARLLYFPQAETCGRYLEARGIFEDPEAHRFVQDDDESYKKAYIETDAYPQIENKRGQTARQKIVENPRVLGDVPPPLPQAQETTKQDKQVAFSLPVKEPARIDPPSVATQPIAPIPVVAEPTPTGPQIAPIARIPSVSLPQEPEKAESISTPPPSVQTPIPSTPMPKKEDTTTEITPIKPKPPSHNKFKFPYHDKDILKIDNKPGTALKAAKQDLKTFRKTQSQRKKMTKLTQQYFRFMLWKEFYLARKFRRYCNWRRSQEHQVVNDVLQKTMPESRPWLYQLPTAMTFQQIDYLGQAKELLASIGDQIVPKFDIRSNEPEFVKRFKYNI